MRKFQMLYLYTPYGDHFAHLGKGKDSPATQLVPLIPDPQRPPPLTLLGLLTPDMQLPTSPPVLLTPHLKS